MIEFNFENAPVVGLWLTWPAIAVVVTILSRYLLKRMPPE
jgi:hypothetical protein